MRRDRNVVTLVLQSCRVRRRIELHRRQVITMVIVIAGVSIGVVGAQWRTCETSQLDSSQPTTHSPDESVQVALYTTSCHRWWARQDDQETLSYVMLPVGERPPAKPNEADIVYQVNWLKAGRSEATSPLRSDMGAEEEVRGGILLTCEKSWCPNQEAILKQVDQWHGHRIFYERK
jgi:hypothetical protein